MRQSRQTFLSFWKEELQRYHPASDSTPELAASSRLPGEWSDRLLSRDVRISGGAAGAPSTRLFLVVTAAEIVVMDRVLVSLQVIEHHFVYCC